MLSFAQVCTIVLVLWTLQLTMARLSYSREELFNIGARCSRPTTKVSLDVYHTLQEYGICKVKPTKRGHRAFEKQQRQIPVIVSQHTKNHDICTTKIDSSVLINTRAIHQKTYLPSIMLFNARSLNNKFSDFEATLDTYHKNIHIVAVTETWFSPENPAAACQLPSYRQFHRDRQNQIGGGVALYVSEDLNVQEVFTELVPTHLEVLWVRLRSSGSIRLPCNIYICVLYSPPRSPYKEELNDHIIAMVDVINSTSDNASFMILGDFNDLSTDQVEQHALLTQVVNQATRGAAVLDKIMTDLSESYQDPVISAPIASSDHCVVTYLPINSVPSKTKQKVSLRPFRDSAICSFGRWVSQVEWTLLRDIDDPNDMVEEFQHLLSSQYRQHFDLITVKRRPTDKPWLTDYIRRLIKQRARAFHRDPVTYKALRNRVKREIRSSKANFYAHKVQILKKSEPGRWHQQIRNLCGLRKQVFRLPDSDKTPLEVANELNVHFAGICSGLPPLNVSSLSSYLPAPAPPPVIEQHQVYSRLQKLNTSKAGHPDDCPTRLWKEFAYELSGPLTVIFNKCLDKGCFPRMWKRASVCPIPKGPRVSSFDQLRPISITSIIARVFEGFLAEWVMRDIHHLVDIKQFGNMKGSSLVHYLVSMLDKIHQGVDKPGHVANLCAVDFSKAFDHVNHTIVVEKLIQLGVERAIIPTISDFLSHRSQAVRYHGVTSSSRDITCGVPQGTKLGPILFLVMVNDAACSTENRWKYVDDLSLVEVVRKDQPPTLQLHVDSLVEWCRRNDMRPNPSKCKAMKVTFLRSASHPLHLQIDDVALEDVSSLKLLGVIIQNDLKWDEQVKRLISNAARRLFILSKLKKNGVLCEDLVDIYKTYIRPLVEFAAPVWASGITNAQSLGLERVQRRALRIIAWPNLLPYNELLPLMNVTSLSDRRQELVSKFAHSLLQSERHRQLLPETRMRTSGRSLRNSSHLDIPRTRTARYKQSPLPYFVKLLNSSM